jgi:AraC family transcriptional regulator
MDLERSHYCDSVRRSANLPAARVTLVGYGANAELPWHSHRNRAVLLPLRGSFVEIYGDAAFNLSRGTAMLRPPAVPHTDRFAAPAQLLIVEPHEQWLASLGLSLASRPTLLEHPTAALCADELARELAAPDAVSPIAIEAALLRLFCGFARAIAPPNDAWIEQVRKQLTRSWFAYRTFGAVAREVGVHPGYAAQRFNERYGCSPAEYVRKLRLAYVCERLERSRDPIATIAAQAGFADQAHLSRVFKKALGTSPREFRRRGN